MDIIYPICKGSKYQDDVELRFSLRSLEQQSWVGKVYLVGHRPAWAINVHHIPQSDPYLHCKDVNIINKVLRACYERELSEEFLVNSDDQLFLRPIAPEDITPMLERGTSASTYRVKATTNNWYRRVRETMDWCRANKHPDWILQSHTPYVVSKHLYPEVMMGIPWARGNGFFTHVYFNLTESRTPPMEPAGYAVRIKAPLSISSIRKEVLPDSVFLNFNNNGLSAGMLEWLKERFPKPSRWEV